MGLKLRSDSRAQSAPVSADAQLAGVDAAAKEIARLRVKPQGRWDLPKNVLAAIPADTTVLSAGSTKPQVAITIDDGPGKATADMLKALDRLNARATFFILGQNAEADPAMVGKIVEGGHVVANHSWSHSSIPGLTAEQQRKELTEPNDLINKLLGRKASIYRPPYGATNRQVNLLARSLGLTTVAWSVDSLDWTPGITAEQIVSNVLNSPELKAGAIILMHDAGGSTRQPSIDALPKIIAGLRQRGLEPVTLPVLLTQSPPTDDDVIHEQGAVGEGGSYGATTG